MVLEFFLGKRRSEKSRVKGWTALHMAAMNTKLDCIQFLVDTLNIDVNTTNETGWTALHLASRGKPETAALDCVTYLISNGADVNKLNDMRISSVHQAVSANNLQCVATLVKHGACVTQPDKRGLLPLDVAKVWGHSECSKYLQNVMWMQQKKEEEKLRKRWIIEHQRSLEKEIELYTESRVSPRVQNAYKAWAKSKGSSNPNIPNHCLARAKPLTCYQDPKMPEFRRLQLSQKLRERMSSPNSNRSSPRQQLERVKKIQELRREGTSKERDIPGPLSPQITKIHTPKPANRSKSKPLRAGSPGTGIQPPLVDRRRKRRQNKSLDNEPDSLPSSFPVQVDNYFKETTDVISPDSGYGDEAVGSTDTASDTLTQPTTPSDLDIKSVNSMDLRLESERVFESLSRSLECSDLHSKSKSVTFNESIEFEVEVEGKEHNSSRILNDSQLRSCLKKRLSSSS